MTSQGPPIPCASEGLSLYPGPALTVCEEQLVPSEHLFCCSRHQPLRKLPADPLYVLQSDTFPAWLQTAVQQGTLSES